MTDDVEGGPGPIEGVQVQSGRPGAQQRRGQVECRTDAALHERGTAGGSQRGSQGVRHPDTGECLEPGEPAQVGQRNDPGKDRDAHAGVGGRVGQRHVVGRVVEDLGDGQVRTGGLLGGQDLDGLDVIVRGRVGGHGDRDMALAVTEEVGLDLPDDPNEVVSVAQLPGDLVGPGAGRGIAAQRQDAPHAHTQKTCDDVDGLLLAVTDTGQVSHQRDGAGLQHVGEHTLGGVGLLLDHAHARKALLIRPAPSAGSRDRLGDEGGAVGHRDEVGSGGQEPVDSPPGR